MKKMSGFMAILLLLALIAFLLLSSVAFVQSGGYDLAWNTIDGGGYTWSEGGGYSLGGTIGQPDAGAISGEGYTLAGGFWGGGLIPYRINLPLVLRNY